MLFNRELNNYDLPSMYENYDDLEEIIQNIDTRVISDKKPIRSHSEKK